MKRIIILPALLLIVLQSIAQSDKTTEILKQDTILQMISKHLPAGWFFAIDDTSISVIREGKYAFFESDCSSISPDSLAKIPLNETARLSFRYEEIWSPERVFWTRETNDSISIAIQSLPQQLRITHLVDAEKSTRYNKVYVGKTKDEKEKVANYYRQRAQMMQNYHPLPNFNTTLFSISLTAQTAMQKPGQCVYPMAAYKEALSVYILFLEYCNNPLESGIK